MLALHLQLYKDGVYCFLCQLIVYQNWRLHLISLVYFYQLKSAIIVINCVSPSIITKVIILQSVKKKKIPNRSCHCKNSLRICCPFVVLLGNRRRWAGVWSTGWHDRGWGRLGMMNGLADNNCHNPTNKTKQNKTTLVGVVLLSVKTHHHHGCDYILSNIQAT